MSKPKEKEYTFNEYLETFHPNRCRQCNGTGAVKVDNGLFSSLKTVCLNCNGEGVILPNRVLKRRRKYI
jgi:DnaJ-class molecular chaperone